MCFVLQCVAENDTRTKKQQIFIGRISKSVKVRRSQFKSNLRPNASSKSGYEMNIPSCRLTEKKFHVVLCPLIHYLLNFVSSFIRYRNFPLILLVALNEKIKGETKILYCSMILHETNVAFFRLFNFAS